MGNALIKVFKLKSIHLISGSRTDKTHEQDSRQRLMNMFLNCGMLVHGEAFHGCFFRSLKLSTLPRLMNAEDANVFGTVHGGKILQMVEEAGNILVTRYCNKRKHESTKSPATAALVRIQRTNFLKPVQVGEVVEVMSQLTYTSQHSLMVDVTVNAENIMKGATNKTNHARLWYVPISVDSSHDVLPVQRMEYYDVTIEEKGRRAYEQQKQERNEENGKINLISMRDTGSDSEKHTVPYSKTQLTHFVNVNDVTMAGHCRGGVILKLMDECAGITAAKHCGTVVATASFNTVNFRHRVTKGSLITVTGQVVFTSERTLDIQVIVDVETPWQPNVVKSQVVDGHITFVSVDKQGRPLGVPQLLVKSQKEKAMFEVGRQRYEAAMKLRRMALKK